MDPREKARTKFHFHRPGVDAFNTAKIGQGKNQKPQVTRFQKMAYAVPVSGSSFLASL
jgi:hypothetical protein